MYDATVMVNSYREKEDVFCAAMDSIFSALPRQVIVSTVRGDECIRWLKKYNADVVINEQPGIFQQINAMLPYIKSKYTCYASSNDIMYPHKIKEEIAVIGKGKVCYSAFKVKNLINGKKFIRRFRDVTYEAIKERSFIPDCAMVESGIMMKYMPFRVQYGNYAYRDLWLRIWEGEGDVFVYNPNPTWEYIVSKESQHVRHNKDKYKKAERLRDKLLMLSHHP